MSDPDSDPEFSIQAMHYKGDAESWGRIITLADFILDTAGTPVAAEVVEAEWESEMFHRKFTLIRKTLGETRQYWLRFPDSVLMPRENQEPLMSFQSDITHVTGLFRAAVSSEGTAEERFEKAEVDLMGYLQTHPLIRDQSGI